MEGRQGELPSHMRQCGTCDMTSLIRLASPNPSRSSTAPGYTVSRMAESFRPGPVRGRPGLQYSPDKDCSWVANKKISSRCGQMRAARHEAAAQPHYNACGSFAVTLKSPEYCGVRRNPPSCILPLRLPTRPARTTQNSSSATRRTRIAPGSPRNRLIAVSSRYSVPVLVILTGDAWRHQCKYAPLDRDAPMLLCTAVPQQL